MHFTFLFVFFFNLCLAIKNTTTESVDANGVHHRHTELVDNTADGKTLTTYVDQTTNPKVTRGPGFGGTSWTIRVVLGSNEVFKLTSSYEPDKTSRGSIAWGPLIKGANLATYTVQQDGKVFGKIDNRDFSSAASAALQVPSNRLVFADGRPPPVLETPPALNLTLTKLHSSLLDVIRLDPVQLKEIRPIRLGLPNLIHPRDSSVLSSDRLSSALVPRGLDRAQDPGHHSFTYDTGSCDSCKVLAMAGVIAAEVACVAGTCWWSFGLGCIACTAAATTAAASVIAACEFSGACCPKTCGAGSFPLHPPSCCFGQETCLANNGQCCRQDQQACAGKQCCNGGQTCIASGLMRGTCCPDRAVCGDKCCPHDDDVCVNGQCCRGGDVCGGICCDPVSPIPLPGPVFGTNLHCANAARSLCCGFGQVEVGGQCCRQGEIIIGGICCKPGGKNCGDGKCCIGECQGDGTCKFNMTDADCRAKGRFEGTCTGKNIGTSECNGCRDGCCFVIPR